MSLARLMLGVMFIVGLLVLARPMARGQDEDEKRKQEKAATKALLDKAEEEYRTFFKRPEKVHEFWAAIKFEIEVGKFDLAAMHLKELLAKEPPDEVDKELFKLEEADGAGAFLRLQTIRKWSDYKPFNDEALKNVDTLIDRVTGIVEKTLGDPERLRKFIKRLDAPTPEERAYSLAQLKRSKERAAPYLVEALLKSVGNPLHRRISEAMVKLDSEIVPPLLEILKAKDAKDAQETDLRPTILGIIHKRGDKRAVPYLWHLAYAPMYPEQVRKQAERVLADFLQTDIDKIPPAKMQLTDMAERYYQHKVRFPANARGAEGERPVIKVWPWNGKELATKPVSLTPSQAEEFFGLRYAREALDLDPKYQPAQMVYLSLMLERNSGALDKALVTPMGPKMQNLLATIDADLLTKVLERALDENKIQVILPAVHALGERGDTRAAKLGAGGAPRGLVRALYYPDRRVQYAAMRAMLKMPTTPVPVASVRIVDVLRRFLSAGETPKAIAAYVPQDRAAEVRQAIKDLGLEPVLVKDVRSAFDKLEQAADYDAVILFPGMADKELPHVVNQFRSDADHGRLPILIFAAKDQVEAIKKQVQRYHNVEVYPEGALGSAEALKEDLEKQLKEAGGMKLTADERKEFGRVALDVLWRMARGEIQGHDLCPAQEAIVKAAKSPDPNVAAGAIEILGRLPGQEPQARLASVVLDPTSKLRTGAAIELNRSIQKNGLLLGKVQVGDLKAAHKTEADPMLKGQLALVIGSMRTSPQATGQQLFEFRPDPPPPPPEKKKEKE